MDWSSFSLGNAAGFIKGPGRLFGFALRSPATDITIGSITVEPRAGNPGTVYELMEDGTSVNALGLPNPGIEAALGFAADMRNAAQTAGKKLRWSIAGSTPWEYQKLAGILSRYGTLEVNLGCPNVWEGAKQKSIASFDLDLMSHILNSVTEATPDFFDVKVSPYSDPSMIQEVAALLSRFGVEHVVTCNTFPNGVADIDTPGGYGGVGGNALYRIALGQVAQFVSALQNTAIKVIGVGGVTGGQAGKRLLGMRERGATGVQIGTDFGERGGRVFSEALEAAIRMNEEASDE